MMTGYEHKGEHVSIGQLDCYVARPAKESSIAILMFSDIFGLHSGRHKLLCDQLAAEGYLVVCPDFFEGGSPLGQQMQFGVKSCKFVCTFVRFMSPCGGFTGWARKHSWNAKLRADVCDRVLPWLEAQGSKRFACIGFCWGAYGAMRCAAMPEKFSCCVNFHPATADICKVNGEDDLQVSKEVRCPQLVIATSMEPATWRPGGAAQAAMDEAVSGSVFQMAEVHHGFMSRGDVSDKAIRDAVENGYRDMVGFLKTHIAP